MKYELLVKADEKRREKPVLNIGPTAEIDLNNRYMVVQSKKLSADKRGPGQPWEEVESKKSYLNQVDELGQPTRSTRSSITILIQDEGERSNPKNHSRRTFGKFNIIAELVISVFYGHLWTCLTLRNINLQLYRNQASKKRRQELIALGDIPYVWRLGNLVGHIGVYRLSSKRYLLNSRDYLQKLSIYIPQ
ncbi:hypothetical protein Golomagni_01668 [Golovinomyces magnicellulatus]|nr:hypothetical protein Golomagni_01668 [Golovinomyces magnicellulatus]